MATSLYLINPAADFPTYMGGEGFEGWGLPRTAFIADLAIVAVAALAPDDFDVRVTDEHIDPVDFDADVDYVGITGKVNQWDRMKAVADAFRARGKTVLIGGPYATLAPETVRPHCDVLVKGEIEEIAPKLFADLAAGTPQPEYQGTQPDLIETPIPRWDLYPNDRALLGVVQASRSCPFECEFCDVIEYLGRGQRQKPIDLILRDLDALYAAGYRDVLFADDNFTVNPKWCREVLGAVIEWNAKQTDGQMGFVAQVSMDCTRNTDLLDLAAEAGLHTVFVGIETNNVESLKLTKKPQNLLIDMHEGIKRFHERAITVIGGMVVGFDGDGPDIFQHLYEFVEAGTVPIFTLTSLVAPDQTPLHRRLKLAGRLTEDSEFDRMLGDTNIVPLKMSRAELIKGVQWLANRIYEPDAFRRRMLRYIDQLGEPRTPRRCLGSGGKLRPAYASARSVMKYLTQLGPEHERMAIEVCRAGAQKPGAQDHVVAMLLRYAQLTYMYERGQYWEPRVSRAG